MEDKSGAGTNRWIKNGAILVTEVNDILKYFKDIKKLDSIKPKIEIPEQYRKVYNVIDDMVNSDEISRKTKINISEVNAILTMLELEGFIESVHGSYYKKYNLDF